ncbi:MAG TPA: hypothetical protein VGA60_01390, partial [Kiloniellales bacterium]
MQQPKHGRNLDRICHKAVPVRLLPSIGQMFQTGAEAAAKIVYRFQNPVRRLPQALLLALGRMGSPADGVMPD